MLFRAYTPPPPLGDLVENFWLYEGYASPHPKERIPPDGTFKIVFNLAADELRICDPWQPATSARFSGAIVSRPSATPFVSDAAQEASILGVNIRIGGAFALFGPAAVEPGGTHLNLADVWGPRTADLQERLAGAATPRQRVELLERALLARLARRRAHHPAVRVGLGRLGCPGGRTREVARAAGLGERRFGELFKSEIGIGPKAFGRIRRFQGAFARVRQGDTPDWARLAADSGYFDQSHMIRDFVEFSGLSPARYLRWLRELARQGVRVKPNHIPLADELRFFQSTRAPRP
jgi:AraC-like DNA-binding protein